MMEGKRSVLIMMLVLSLCFSSLIFAETQEKIISAPFAQNFNYINQRLAFRIEGPKGWYGAMQGFGPTGERLYPFFPRRTSILYIKYFGEQEKLHPFNPMFEVKVLVKDEYDSAIEAIKHYVRNTAPENFTTHPTTAMFKDKQWAVCAYKISAKIGKRLIPLVRKVYLSFYKDSILLIQVTDTEKEYQNDEKLFDEAVLNMRFSDNYMDLMF